MTSNSFTNSAWLTNDQQEEIAVKTLCERIGAGRVMQLSQKCWRQKLEPMGMAGGEFAYGPCVSSTVACGCRRGSSCDWCCGSGWLTHKVKAARDSGLF